MNKMIDEQENTKLVDRIRELLNRDLANDSAKHDELSNALESWRRTGDSSDILLRGLAESLIEAHEKNDFLERAQEYALMQLDQMQSELELAYSKLFSFRGELSQACGNQLFGGQSVTSLGNGGVAVSSNTARLISLARNFSSMSKKS